MCPLPTSAYCVYTKYAQSFLPELGIRWFWGWKGKNLFFPSESLESPTVTLRFFIHAPGDRHWIRIVFNLGHSFLTHVDILITTILRIAQGRVLETYLGEPFDKLEV